MAETCPTSCVEQNHPGREHDECSLVHLPEPHTIELLWGRPVTVLWDGSLALFIDDNTTSLPIFRGVGKAVTVARLRAIADLIENEVPE